LANNFGGSFADAFEKSYATSSNNYSDMMRDKIKQDQQKADQKYKATTLMHSNIAMASELPDKDMAKKILGIIESVGADPDSQKNIGEMIQKSMMPKEAINVYNVGQSGDLVQAGQVPAGSKVFKKALTADEVGARTEASEGVKYDFKRKDAFAKIQEQVISKGIDMTAEEKAKLVSAKQGQKSLVEARAMLESENFVRLIIQADTGAIGKLSTAGETNLRKYNTAITDTIFNYVFAKSGAQVSDKERRAFEEIYGAKIGDTIDVVKYKAGKLQDFFDITEQVMDPNQVAGLTVAQTTQRLKDIKSQLDELGASPENSELIIDSIKNKAFNSDDMVTIYSKSGKSKKVSKEEAKKMGVKGV